MGSMLSRRSAAAILVIGLLSIWPGVSAGLPVVSLNNPGSTTRHEITLAPGETFDIDVNLSTDMQTAGADCAIQANASGIFDILENTARAPWSSGGSLGGLDPVSARVGWGFPEPLYFGPGATTLANLRIGVDSAAPTGTYVLNARNIAVYGDRLTFSYVVGRAGPAFVVHVVPEPSSVAIVLVFAMAFFRYRF